MSDPMLNEIYQELYAIRAELQSMGVRSSLESIRGALQEIRTEILKLNRALEGSPVEGPEEPGGEPKKRFGFFR